MEIFYVSLLCLFMFLVSFFLHFSYKNKFVLPGSLPPGKTGWPIFGESLEFLSTGWKGHPETFIFDRMAKYSSNVFKTHLLGELNVVFCGASEQMEIGKSKAPGELLKWEDIKKMKYSWNVACEVLRLAPPLQGAFREALSDFTFNGFSIPAGWKIYWSTTCTHKSGEFFSEPEKFDPSRFEGNGPAPYTFVPFGGGPRMCPGLEYARLEILVFMHHLVKRFKWEKIIPHEKIVVNPILIPTKGLPVRL